MPIYEYRCQGCGQLIEAIQKFADPPLEECESCGGPLIKQISAPSVHFKGSGWYVTDYTDKGKSPDAESKSANAEDSPTSKESKAEGATNSSAKTKDTSSSSSDSASASSGSSASSGKAGSSGSSESSGGGSKAAGTGPNVAKKSASGSSTNSTPG